MPDYPEQPRSYADQARVERARWEGRIEGRIDELSRWKTTVNGDIRDIKEEQSRMSVLLSEVKTKTALGGAIGGLIGAGAVGLLVRVLG